MLPDVKITFSDETKDLLSRLPCLFRLDVALSKVWAFPYALLSAGYDSLDDSSLLYYSGKSDTLKKMFGGWLEHDLLQKAVKQSKIMSVLISVTKESLDDFEKSKSTFFDFDVKVSFLKKRPNQKKTDSCLEFTATFYCKGEISVPCMSVIGL